MTIEELLETSGDELEKLSDEELKAKIGPLIVQELVLQKDREKLTSTTAKSTTKKKKLNILEQVAQLQTELKDELEKLNNKTSL